MVEVEQQPVEVSTEKEQAPEECGGTTTCIRCVANQGGTTLVGHFGNTCDPIVDSQVGLLPS
jgi:hypothetical protein